MNRIAKYHLYLGCLFGPLIIFYALSGAWQALNLHRTTKDGRYQPPFIVASLSEVHVRQRWAPSPEPRRQDRDAVMNVLPRTALPYFSALTGLGLATTGLLGIVLAMQRTRGGRRRWAVLCLFGGCAMPVVLLAA